MRLARLAVTLLLAVSLGAGWAGCGSSKKKTNTTSSTAKSKTTTTTAKSKTGTTKTVTKYKAGQFCSTSKQTQYKAAGYTCVKGHLKVVATSSTKYKKGQFCSPSKAAQYKAAGLTCTKTKSGKYRLT